MTLSINYKARSAKLVSLLDSGLQINVMESEKDEREANETLLHLLGLALNIDSSSLSLDWDVILSCLVVVIPGRNPKQVFDAIQAHLASN